MARVGYGLPKVSVGAAMAYPSMPCERATPETAVLGVARPQAKWPAAIFYLLDTPRRTHMLTCNFEGSWIAST
jgi:hypothetical protein